MCPFGDGGLLFRPTEGETVWFNRSPYTYRFCGPGRRFITVFHATPPLTIQFRPSIPAARRVLALWNPVGVVLHPLCPAQKHKLWLMRLRLRKVTIEEPM